MRATTARETETLVNNFDISPVARAHDRVVDDNDDGTR